MEIYEFKSKNNCLTTLFPTAFVDYEKVKIQEHNINSDLIQFLFSYKQMFECQGYSKKINAKYTKPKI